MYQKWRETSINFFRPMKALVFWVFSFLRRVNRHLLAWNSDKFKWNFLELFGILEFLEFNFWKSDFHWNSWLPKSDFHWNYLEFWKFEMLNHYWNYEKKKSWKYDKIKFLEANRSLRNSFGDIEQSVTCIIDNSER